MLTLLYIYTCAIVLALFIGRNVSLHLSRIRLLSIGRHFILPYDVIYYELQSRVAQIYRTGKGTHKTRKLRKTAFHKRRMQDLSLSALNRPVEDIQRPLAARGKAHKRSAVTVSAGEGQSRSVQ